jgi:hypothetical protein
MKMYDICKEKLTVGVIKIQGNMPEQNRFTSIGDFKWCMKCGGEVQFSYKGKNYAITPRDNDCFSFSEAYKQETEEIINSIENLLNCKIDGVRLRDIITTDEVLITERTI